MPPIRRHILIPRLRRSEMLEPSTPLRDITVLADGAVNAAASMINEAYEPDVDWTGDMMNVSGSFVVTDPDKSQPALYVVTEPRNENMGKLQEDSNARALRSLQNQFDDFRTRSDRKISKLKSKVDRSDRKISELKSKVDRSDRKISDLERKAARLDHENIRLCAELSASGRKITSLQDEVRDLKLVTSSLMPVQRRKLLEFAKKKSQGTHPQGFEAKYATGGPSQHLQGAAAQTPGVPFVRGCAQIPC
ncbi:hypothetical protein F5J12DRAFT_229886 [Pisolithus orientalis]|uniref:uncharacterized protein n=1 Tax=Pisolithus orientalis TaxID=936130 RepID=UPI002225A28D|nr:uncharacterized protein F5J12DRAFT_229886 [Pisolithus orientalis]KAI6002328.1 hypothetical protein F5J12DRAFT_229886 [Pisolithus orientalis]